MRMAGYDRIRSALVTPGVGMPTAPVRRSTSPLAQRIEQLAREFCPREQSPTRRNDLLAARLDASRAAVKAWRLGKAQPYAARLQRLGELGVSLDWHLLGVGPMRRGVRETGLGVFEQLRAHQKAHLVGQGTMADESESAVPTVGAPKQGLHHLAEADLEALRRVKRDVDVVARATGRDADAKKEARLAVRYQTTAASGASPVDWSAVLKLDKGAAG